MNRMVEWMNEWNLVGDIFVIISSSWNYKTVLSCSGQDYSWLQPNIKYLEKGLFTKYQVAFH